MNEEQRDKARREKLMWIAIVNILAWILIVILDQTTGQTALVQIFFAFILILLAGSIAIGLKLYRGDTW